MISNLKITHLFFIPCVEIQIYGDKYPILSSNNYIWSTHNWPRCIFQNSPSIRAIWKIVGGNFFGKVKIDGNLVVKSKVPPGTGSVAFRQLNPCFSFFPFLKGKIKHEIKSTQKNESELGDIYILFIYRSVSFYR